MSTSTPPELEDFGQYKFGWHDPAASVFTPKRGLSADVVREISGIKAEPEWMTRFRLRALEIFERKPMPSWGGNLSEIDFQNIYYYIRASERQGRSWDEVPDDIKKTFDRLGIPEAERKFLAGVSAQYESEVVYHSIREDLEQKGVIFCDTDTALREHEEIFREHWATVIPPGDNKFSALNSAVWSGGSFIWVPEGVRVEIPLQAYFRINQENMGQFERTLIICEPGSFVHYVEGCTAPVYSSDSLHSAVVEIIVKKGARCRYTTIQNWSTNVYNLVTKRAVAHEDATMEWVDGNLGSRLTMKYPAVWMTGRRARGEVLSVAFASEGMHQDAGAKMVHVAPDTSSTIVSKSISKGGGRTSYRGLVRVEPGARRVKASVVCDALLLDEDSRSDTYPYMDIQEEDTSIGHEATVSKVADAQLFYLMSRGLSEEEAMAMIVRGFIEPIAKELPMEYAVELNRLIELQMEGSIG
ncbi:MAG TPA: Fe-S cluster assembly protein SufB [Miltoncostaeaceae bacterium]|nr:Fe-S cluster assembly protein SufB [Miltoncostaeaceae bacterium]